MNLVRFLSLSMLALLLSACNLTVKSNHGGEVRLSVTAQSCKSPVSPSYPEFLATQCFTLGNSQTVNLTPEPAPGYHFVEWRGACEGSGACALTMNAARNVTAIFAPDHEGVAVSRTFTDAQDIVYLFDAEANEVRRWHGSGKYYIRPLTLTGDALLATISLANARIYIAFSDNTIKQLDYQSNSPVVQNYVTLPGTPEGLAAADTLVYAVGPTASWKTHYLYNAQGQLLTTREGLEYSQEYVWDSVNKRMYFFRDNTLPNDIHYQTVDVSAGVFGEEHESPYHGAYAIQHPLRISADGNLVFIGSGDIYNASDLTLHKSLPVSPVDATWTNQALITLREQNGTLLEQWGADLKRNNIQYFAGTPVHIVPLKSSYLIVTRVNGELRLNDYQYTLDGDRDGIPFVEDDFPLDAAAALDSDQDGHPDHWNVGYSDADSTTGLTVDAFPADAACQRANQGIDGVCNIVAQIPAYAPEQIAADRLGVVHLFDKETQRVYRWSAITGKHLNPVILGEDATTVAINASTGQLYVGYVNGEITRRAPDVAKPLSFATVSKEVRALAVAGDYLMAGDDSGAWHTHYLFSSDGLQTDSRDLNHYSRYFDWDANKQRMYFFRDETSPNDLLFEQINQETGTIVAEGDSPYHGDYPIQGPIRVSNDGNQVWLGSGNVYETTGLNVVKSFGFMAADAAWTSDNELVMLVTRDTHSEIRHYGLDYTLYGTQTIAGTPLSIVRAGDQLIVVTQEGQPRFTSYTVSIDGDEDGVANSEDAFPTDKAASVDTDGDGYPDQWNTGLSASDSSTGLVLDIYPNDRACQLAEHGVDGVCDFANIIPVEADRLLCDTDDTAGVATRGSVTLDFPVSAFVPLCSGWVIAADQFNKQIKIVNVFSNRTAQHTTLTTAPSALFLDSAHKVVYATTQTAGEIAKISLVDEAVTYFSLNGTTPITDMDHGPNNTLLVKAGAHLSAFTKDNDSFVGSWPMSGAMFVFNNSRNEIVSAERGYSPSRVYRYSFTLASGPALLQSSFALGSNGADLDLSPDNMHLAFAAGGGNGGGYTIYDIDPSNITLRKGIWNNGAYPQSTAFSLSSDILVSRNYSDLLVFRVSDYSLLASAPLTTSAAGVAISRGNRIAFAAGNDRYSAPTQSTYTWLVYR